MSAPLHAAIKAGVDDFDGVYITASAAFPTQTWLSANYWVDVVLDSSTAMGPGYLHKPRRRVRNSEHEYANQCHV